MKITTILPDDRFSSVDLFLEIVQLSPGLLDETKCIMISQECVVAMLEDPYIEYLDGSWVGEEVTIEGKYYPPIQYWMSDPDAETGYCFVTKIISGEKELVFSETPGEDDLIVIFKREQEV